MLEFVRENDRFWAVSHEPRPIEGDTLPLCLLGEHGEGTLWLGGLGHFVKDGVCALPAAALREGENAPVYTGDGRRAELEKIVRYGNTLFFCVRDAWALCLRAAERAADAHRRLAEAERRLKNLENQCFGPSLFDLPGKDIS